MFSWQRFFTRNKKPIVKKYECYNLRLEDIFGAETTHLFCGLAELFQSKYFQRLSDRHCFSQIVIDSDEDDLPQWQERINIIANGFRQKMIRKIPFFRPPIGANFVIFCDDGRIDRLVITPNRSLLTYYHPGDDLTINPQDESNYRLANIEVGHSYSLSTGTSSSCSLGRVVKIIMLLPESKWPKRRD